MPRGEESIEGMTGAPDAALPRTGLRSLLLGLALAALLPALMFGTIATWRSVQQARAEAEAALQVSAASAGAAIDRALDAHIAALQAFATSPLFAVPPDAVDVAALAAQARRLKAELGDAVSVLRPDGSRLATSYSTSADAVPHINSTEALRQAVETGAPAVSNLVLGGVSREYTVTFDVPVKDASGHVVFVVTSSLLSRQLSALLASSAMQTGSGAVLVDARRVIIGSNVGSIAVGRAMRPDNAARMGPPSGMFRAADFTGDTRIFSFRALRVAPGWRVFVTQPISVFDAAWYQPLITVGLGGTFAVICGVLIALLAGRRILRPIEQLRAYAAAQAGGRVAAGDAARLPESNVAELEELRRAFVTADAALRDRGAAETAARDALAASEAELRALLEASPVGIAEALSDGTLLECNAALLDMLGITREDLDSGRWRWTDATPPRWHAVTERAIAQAMASPTGVCTPFEKEFVRGDGSLLPVLVSFAMLVKPEPGRLGRAVTFVVDLTEIRRNQRHLAESEERYRTLADATREAVVIHENGVIVDANEACRTMLGVASVAELIGRNVIDMHIPECRALAADNLRIGDGAPYESVAMRADGSRFPIEVEGRPLRYQGRTLRVGIARDLTRQKAADQAIRDAAARMRGLLDTVTDGILVASADGRIVSANPAAQKIFGYRDEADMQGRRLNELMPPAEAARHDAHLAAHLQTGQSRALGVPGRELMARRQDGSEFPIDLSVSSFRTDEGRFFTGVVRDATERRAAEQALRQSEEQRRLLLDNLHEGVALCEILYDEAGNANDLLHLEVNGGWERLVGIPASAARGRRQSELMPGLEAAWLEAFDQVVRHGEVRHIELPIAGLGRIFECFAFPLGGTRFGVSFVDITERQQAQQALAQSEARWRGLAEALPELVWTCDAEGQCTYVNQTWHDYTGVADDRHLGAGWLDAAHPDERAGRLADWRRAMAERVAYTSEGRLRGADGTYRWFKNRAVPLFAADGSITQWFGTSADITELVAAHDAKAREADELERLVAQRTRELRESEARLVQAAKMEALGRLAGGVAHDFNNILQAVQGGVNLASRRLATQPEQARNLLDMVGAAASRGAAVTKRLLSFARRSELDATPVPTAALLRGLVPMLRHTLRPSIVLSVTCDADVPALFADAGELETVLVNLVNNARDAMPDEGGQISLEAAVARPEECPAELAAGEYVRVTVIDNGAGMSAEVLARVSEPFFTTKPRGQGTGLGVAMARGFAEQSGGMLAIASQPGAGTTATLFLPVATQEAAAVAPDVAAEFLAAARVLLVDDEPAVRLVLAELLEHEGLDVTQAPGGAEALALLRDMAPDVLVTDLSMPGGMDGLALVQAARRLYPGLPAVLLTGHVQEAKHGALTEAAEAGPFAVLHKPVPAGELQARIALLLRDAA